MKSSENERPSGTPVEVPASFDALYNEYGIQIYRFCYRLCGNRTDAEDLTQEVFVAALKGLHQFEARSSLATWLYRIATYQWRRMCRERSMNNVSLEEESVLLLETDNSAQSHIERLTLESALASLPPPLREAFVLVKAEGLKYREASKALGIPQGTVQSRVSEAVTRLRAALEDKSAGSADRLPLKIRCADEL